MKNWIKRLFGKKPTYQRNEPNFFWDLYWSKKENDDLGNYVWEEASKLGCDFWEKRPSKNLIKRYGRHTNPLVWAILEEYFENKKNQK